MRNTYFEGFLRINVQNEDESYNRSDQTSHIGKVSIDFVETSIVDSCFGTFVESDLGIM